MAAPALTLDKPGLAVVSGDLTLHTVSALIDKGQELISEADGELTFDFSDVVRFSSAGVALLLNWMRSSVSHNVRLRIVNPPQDLDAIVRICDLEEVFEPLLDQSA
ncbi:MAG: STAS domain-containing protein [Thalassolituus sp.]